MCTSERLQQKEENYTGKTRPWPRRLASIIINKCGKALTPASFFFLIPKSRSPHKEAFQRFQSKVTLTLNSSKDPGIFQQLLQRNNQLRPRKKSLSHTTKKRSPFAQWGTIGMKPLGFVGLRFCPVNRSDSKGGIGQTCDQDQSKISETQRMNIV